MPAEKAATAFDGEGARLYGGRWNPPGIPMVYASEHQSLAAMELRVHIDKTSMRRPYKRFSIHFEEELMKTLEVDALPKSWQQEPSPPWLQQLGAEWIKSGRSAILAVPSVIIPQERNFLINPNHPDFRRIRIDPPTTFAFDQRLFT